MRMSGLGHYWVDITKATATFRQCLDFVRTFGTLVPVRALQQVAFHQVRLEGLLKKYSMDVFQLFLRAFQQGRLFVLG